MRHEYWKLIAVWVPAPARELVHENPAGHQGDSSESRGGEDQVQRVGWVALCGEDYIGPRELFS